MKPLSFIKRIASQRRHHKLDQECENDLSYEDALLDWKLRRFMQAEYGQAKPPEGVFNKVLAAIKKRESAALSAGSWLKSSVANTLGAIYRAMSRPTATSRILPGVVAFGLVVLVLSTNVNNTVFKPTLSIYPGYGTYSNGVVYNNSNIDSEPAAPDSRIVIATKLAEQTRRDEVTRRGIVPEGLIQFYPPSNIEFYHRVERHMPLSKLHTTEAYAQATNPEYLVISKYNGF